MNGWIDIHNTPKDGQEVLMTYNNLVLIGVYKNKKFYQDIGCAHIPGYCSCDEQEGITHWMPIPEAPNE